MKRFALGGFTVAMVAACASTPQHSQQLELARSQVETLGRDPHAQQAASDDLTAARASLEKAELSLQRKQPAEIVDHFAYLARRRAEAGEARIAEWTARQELERGHAERDQILLDAQNRKARAAEQQTELAEQQARSDATQLAATRQRLADLRTQKPGRVVVLNENDLLFDTGKATLHPGADVALDRVAAFLNNNPQSKIRIQGYTDSQEPDPTGALSEDRAQAVAAALTARGIEQDRMTTIGRGASFPIAPNDTAGGRLQNRRAAVVFSDASGHFPTT